MNNPMIIVDPNGMDTLYFSSTGQYESNKTKKGEGDHVGYYINSDGKLVQFAFNDQSDASSILSSTTDKWVPNNDKFLISGINIGENKIGEMFLSINKELGKDAPISYPLAQSQENGLMDYAAKISSIDPSINRNVTVIDGAGYNNFDLGNYYWGRTMGALGYSPGIAKLSATAFELIKNQRNDHPTDQRAIEHGARKK